MTQRWCIITPQYPPLPGSIGEHSWLLAQALTAAGDEVEVWIPPGPTAPPLPGVVVHVLPSEYGLDALRVLARAIRGLPPESRVLVQYAPTAFGMRRLNLPFAMLLAMQARRGIELYFHGGGYALRWHQSPRRTAAGVLHRLMTWLVVRSARRVFVAIPEWQRHLRRLGVRESDRDRVVTWVPVPSMVPDQADAERVRAIRATVAPSNALVIGHFGRFGAFHQRLIPPLVARVLDDDRRRTMLLIGHGSGAVRDAIAVARPDLAYRVVATGHLDAAELSVFLSACDVMLQPYEEGASASRSSLVAGLALGRAIVSNAGAETGALWTTRRSLFLTRSYDVAELARAVTTLLDDPALRAALGADARALHDELFAMSRGIARLRSTTPGTIIAEDDDMPAEAPGGDAAADGRLRLLLVHDDVLDVARPSPDLARTVHHLANALADGGAKVTVAARGSAPGDARYELRTLATGGLRRALGPFVLNLLPFGRFDVVHFFSDDWPVIRRPRPVVRTVFPLGAAPTWRARAARALARRLDRLSAGRATIAVASGRGVAARTGIEQVIGGGVDVEHFAPPERRTSQRILFIGTLHGAGRGGWLYDLFRERIAPRLPEAELHLVADVAPPSQPWLRFESIGGDVDRAAAYREARVLVVPATQPDADPALLEAMASGVPVLATPTAGAVDLLGNGRFGVLADDGVFVDALFRLLADDETQRRLARAARGRAEESSWPRVAAAYREVYERAMLYHVGVPAPHGPPPLAPVRAGALHGLVTARRPSIGAALGERRLWSGLDALLEGAASFVDVGAGAGDASLYALAHRRLATLVAIEPDRRQRETLQRTLSANGFALDPRVAIDSRAIGARADDMTRTLDDVGHQLASPLLVRVGEADALDAVLSGASSTLARRGARWIVAVPAGRLTAVGDRFRAHGYSVHPVRTRWPAAASDWIVARND